MAKQTNTQKALKGMSSQTIVTIGLGVVEIVSFSIMSRLLTQEDFGYYAAITAITAVFASFSETGMGASIIQKKDITDRFINNAFTISFLFGCFVALLLLVLAKPLSSTLVDGSMIVPLMLMSITLLFHNIISVNNSIMYKRLQFLRVGLINFSSLVITTIVAVILALHGYGYHAIIAKAVLTSILTLIFSFMGARMRYKFQLDMETFKTIFSFSGWLMASVFFRNLAMQMDRLLMTRLLSVSALGSYNRPKEFINQISSKLNGVFDTALFPVLSDIQDDMPKVRSAYIRSFYYMNIFAIVLTCAFIFNSELIIRIFFGEQWMSILITLQILSCVLVFNIDGRLADCYLRSLGWSKIQFFFRIFEVVMKIVALLIGAMYGINGVAIGVVIVNVITIWAKNVYITKRIGVNLKDSISTILNSWRIGLVLIPIMSISHFITPSNLIGNILNLVVFAITIFISFVIVPGIVGSKYKSEAFVAVKSFLVKKVKLKIINEK